MHIVCSDLEGILVPEIWINVAEITGIDDLRLTTRDIADYDELMTHRLKILDKCGLKLHDIQRVISRMEPLGGALEFMNWLRQKTQIIIVSDTFVEFAGPLMQKLSYPTLLCNTLVVDPNGTIENYRLRQPDGKQKVARALQQLNYSVIAVGDSYNDITMLQAADQGILFCPPDKVREQYNQFPVAANFKELKRAIGARLNGGH